MCGETAKTKIVFKLYNILIILLENKMTTLHVLISYYNGFKIYINKRLSQLFCSLFINIYPQMIVHP